MPCFCSKGGIVSGWDKFSTTVKRYLPLFVVISIGMGVVVGYFFPHIPLILKRYVYICIFWMLIPMMVAANVGGIAKVFVNPKLILSAVILNFLITPPLGKLFAKLFYTHQPVLLPVGYILNMVTPCSDMVIAWTGFAGGSIEVATAIVALSLILAILFIPVWMWVLTHTWVHVPVMIIFKNLGVIVVIPILVGYLIRTYLVRKMGEGEFLKIKKAMPAISSLGMYAIVFIAMAMVATKIVAHPTYIVLVAVSMGTYYFALWGIALLWAKTAKFGYGETIALTYAVTAKNLSITIAIAMVTWGGLAVLVPAFDPVIQVPVMLAFLYLSTQIKPFFLNKRK